MILLETFGGARYEFEALERTEGPFKWNMNLIELYDMCPGPSNEHLGKPQVLHLPLRTYDHCDGKPGALSKARCPLDPNHLVSMRAGWLFNFVGQGEKGFKKETNKKTKPQPEQAWDHNKISDGIGPQKIDATGLAEPEVWKCCVDSCICHLVHLSAAHVLFLLSRPLQFSLGVAIQGPEQEGSALQDATKRAAANWPVAQVGLLAGATGAAVPFVPGQPERGRDPVVASASESWLAIVRQWFGWQLQWLTMIQFYNWTAKGFVTGS